MESRIQKMRDRVHELRETREKERLEVVKTRLNDQWRRGCDDLRTLESKAAETQVAAYRSVQLKEKEDQKLAIQKENVYYAAMWEQDRQKKIVREEMDKQHQEDINRDTIATLKEQLSLLRQQDEREKDLELEEAHLMVIQL